MNHTQLTELAVKWLKRPNSQNGHGCLISASELRSGWDGEIPDAIGFRLDGNIVTSIVVEAKATRSDFLCDKKKEHRQSGMGDYRYYICPEGLIKPEELPEKWGLLWVNARGHIKVISGAANTFGGHWQLKNEALISLRFAGDKQREQWLLVKILSRVGDVEQMNRWIKESKLIANRVIKERDKLQVELKTLRLQIWNSTHRVVA
ncbi:MAG TPA: hypothetical protein VK958_06430 [Methylophilus sp.]|uniref:hypothetical protein n=1 Tax=Methylophilus sp. TaxID=29541 RepID=UPI002B538329|nr:hypothetical protein [Methylophilus sp.]HSH86871.1 hypothetical protein [Methylophilus sp.]